LFHVTVAESFPGEVFVEISGINGTLGAPVVAPLEKTPKEAAENRSIIQAVKAVNETEMFGQDNFLAFQRDPYTKRMVVQVINKQTREVVSQIPPEYVLRLSEDMKQRDGG
jgi:uncharacterized FlaG/YvyC family protein